MINLPLPLIGLCLVLLLAGGCDQGSVRPPARRGHPYPAMNEAPPPAPPPLPASRKLDEVDPSPSKDPPAVVLDDFQLRERLMDEQVKTMREYAAQADPDDPFAMSEEEIEAFRKKGDPFVF